MLFIIRGEIMLIYVNQFELSGTNCCDTAFQTVSGWLKEVTGKYLSVEQLKSGEEFTVDKAKIRTYTATDYEPLMYSILFSHPDKSVRGRQWITEIGVKVEGEKTTLSLLLETSEISTLVQEHPTTTRPRLVYYLQKNEILHRNTIGQKVIKLKNESDSFIALSREIEHEDRSHPLVLVSNKKETEKPLLDPNKLQEQLLGLAQVVHIEQDVNSWDLEDVLTRQYSAWDGAVNIIYPSFGRGYCSNRLLVQDKINELNLSGVNVLRFILSYITHTTNGFNKKKHFRPTDVRTKRQRDFRLKLKEKYEALSEDNDYKQLFEQAMLQLEEQEHYIDTIKEEKSKEVEEQIIETIEVQDRLDKKTIDYDVLEMRFKELSQQSTKKGKVLLVYGEEKDYYNGEINDLAIEAIKNLLESTQANSRKHDILKDIIKNNEVDGTKKSYIENCKQIFGNYNGVTPRIKSELKNMRMEIIEDGNHNQIKFIDDDRYKVACAKTPSDSRVGANIVRDIRANLL